MAIKEDRDLIGAKKLRDMEGSAGQGATAGSYAWTKLVRPKLGYITRWLSDGDSRENVARKLGLRSRATLKTLELKYPELADAIYLGMRNKTDDIMDAMYDRAKGYEKKLLKEKVSAGKLFKAYEEVHIPGDVNAADLVLRNNLPGYRRQNDAAAPVQTVNVNIKELKVEMDQHFQTIQVLEGMMAKAKDQKNRLIAERVKDGYESDGESDDELLGKTDEEHEAEYEVVDDGEGS